MAAGFEIESEVGGGTTARLEPAGVRVTTMSRSRILIVEDDAALARVIVDNLTFAGFQVSSARDGDEAVDHLRTLQPDLVLLDLMLPDRNGFELCGVLREGGRMPVVILSARAPEGRQAARARARRRRLRHQAVRLDELLARIQAVLRRSRRAVNRLVLGDVTIDFDALRAVAAGARRAPDPQRVRAAALSGGAARQVVYRDELLREIWGYLDMPSATRSVDHAVARLRKKIEADPHRPTFIRTVHGDGYVLSPSADAPKSG